MITEIRAFEGGYCRQLLAMVDRRTWRMVRFQAVFFALRHATRGWVLVDTGYGGKFAQATMRFPQRLYRWMTPATPAGGAAALLALAGIDAAEVRHVIVTHFHADHVGGLAEFPGVTVHYHADALAPLQALPVWRQVRAAFLADLIPAWLPRQAIPIAAEKFTATEGGLPFASHDLFGDGTVQLVHLPGHAPGQVGVAFALNGSRHLYAADAFWRDCQLVEDIEPHPLARWLQWDAAAYRGTVAQLRTVRQQGDWQITACHDEGSCARLNLSGFRAGGRL